VERSLTEASMIAVQIDSKDLQPFEVPGGLGAEKSSDTILT
jgi:hypothetical protein